MPNGNLVKYNGATWSARTNEDFFFRVYFQTPVTPIETINNVDFTTGNFRGIILDDNGNITSDIKFLNALLVDDTASISWSDPFYGTGTELKSSLPNFLTNLYSRTDSNMYWSGTGNYKTSYTDYWVISTQELNRTSGYSNDLDSIALYSSALFQRGLNSTLLGTAPLVMSGLNYQSVYDAIIKENDTVNNRIRVNDVVLYLDSISCLRLNDIIDYWNSLPSGTRSAWGDPSGGNFTSDTICNYSDVTDYLINRWAKTFIPLGTIIGDGDNSSAEASSVTALAANSAWGDSGAPVLTFGLGKSHKESKLREISSDTNGYHFHISESGDWDNSLSTLLHNGANNLFKSSWSKKYDFLNPTWVSGIGASFTPVIEDTHGTSCAVRARWSFDRLNFTPWAEIPSGSDYTLKEEILALEYQVELTDGWNIGSSSVIRPVLESLYHKTVSPSVQYLYTPIQVVNGMMFEAILSASQFLPDTAIATWGICRGNSTDFADFSVIHTSRKSALPNRQSGVLFTEQSVDSRLDTQGDDNLVNYTVLKNNRVRTWLSTDEILVELKDTQNRYSAVSTSAYSTLPSNGLIIFNPALRRDANGNLPKVYVTITTPSSKYTSKGEPTTTTDYKTYTLFNGRWPQDAIAIVLKNQNIIRGGYWLSPEEGTVTFAKELEPTDNITIYIEHSGYYRVGVEIKNYDPSVDNLGDPLPIDIRNFGLFYTTLDNPSLLSEYNQTQVPSALNTKLMPQVFDENGTLINPTIYQRLTVDYTFNSPNDADENGTEIVWWRYRSAYSGTGQSQVIGGQKYFPITSYNNRITQKKVDIGIGATFAQGDKFFVEVTPSDSFSTGLVSRSNIVTLNGDKVPYIISGIGNSEFVYANANTIQIDQDTSLRSALAGDALVAVYDYRNPNNIPDNFPDNTLVQWYLDSSGGIGATSGVGSTAAFTGKVVAANQTKSGEVYIFKATPYNGQRYGVPVWSSTVYIR
jgi:hypothetical protein